MQAGETISAIATARGKGALAILRTSGPAAVAVHRGIWRGADLDSLPQATQRFGRIVVGGEVVDEVLLTRFHTPHSYTGEDCIEITCHGGEVVTRRILDALLAAGSRMANPGEFTQRAFLNGKIDLTKAEAVADMINARTALAQRVAAAQLQGRLGEQIERLRAQVIELLAHLEAWIDFPEEDIDPDSSEALQSRMGQILEGIRALLRTEERGRILRDGYRVAIVGPPNAGKSSLLNALLGMERAIVSEEPGTTRDFLEEGFNLDGIPVRLVDTAGLRSGGERVEQIGMERTKRLAKEADLVIELHDGSVDPRLEDKQLVETEARRRLVVLNKADLGITKGWTTRAGDWLAISCLTGEGIEIMLDKVREQVEGEPMEGEPLVAIAARHAEALRRAEEGLVLGLEALAGEIPPDLVAVHVRASLAAFGEILGVVDVDEILGVIFSRFCIGK